jgi:ATP-dependent protease ClpP protease subunit
MRIEALAVTDARFAADTGSGLIEIFDTIGEGGTTPARVSGALRSIGSKPVIVTLNSPGGDAFAGLTIFNLLRGHGPGVTVRVLGLAASAASIIAMAGDRIEMARASELMLHRAQAIAGGDADMFDQVSAALKQADSVMAGIYSERSQMPRDQVMDMMRATTFVTAEEAIGLGLADALIARDAEPAPRVTSSTAPQSKRELEERMRVSLGLSRSEASRAAAAGWRAMHDGVDHEPQKPGVDADAIARLLADQIAALMPPNRSR